VLRRWITSAARPHHVWLCKCVSKCAFSQHASKGSSKRQRAQQRVLRDLVCVIRWELGDDKRRRQMKHCNMPGHTFDWMNLGAFVRSPSRTHLDVCLCVCVVVVVVGGGGGGGGWQQRGFQIGGNILR